jgi:hypothetical protein
MQTGGGGPLDVAGAGFHTNAKFRATIPNPIMADRSVYSADWLNENGYCWLPKSAV